MKGLRLLGDYALEFLVITLLVMLSAVTVIPLFPMIVGVTGYLKNGIDARRFKDIFTIISKNWKIIIFYTVFQLIIIVFPILNIYYFNTHLDKLNPFVLAVSCIALFFGIIYLVTAPTIIVNMNVTLRQLFHNGIMLIFGGFVRSLISVICVAGVFALLLFYPFVIFAAFYAVPYIVSRLMKENFYKLKAKALKVSVYDLKKIESADNYIDENGEINREITENYDEKI